ncbi:Protein HYPER-SENSITIVITY-RELATED like [Actinidia chinensis var. chinensis]|uniref:Protein HYPER-SENSITIVITY-RELATED like n=1 Tax=Actinidia chinensis var. chinensis TaxID=1590841 RepID=A0A2R6S2M1_ACTCC|nr:Protein HYPER-SENSITIVITY-RELATED like [Actinidia chinensis var. chinensis]
MIEIHPCPHVVQIVHVLVIDRENLHRLLMFDRFFLLQDVGNAGFESPLFVLLGEGQFEGSDFRSERRIHAVEGISDLFVPYHCDINALFPVGFAELNSASGGGDFGAEVSRGGLVDLVADKTIELVDDHCEFGGESVEEVSEAREEVVLDFCGEVVVGDGSNHHGLAGEGFYSGEDCLGRGEFGLGGLCSMVDLVADEAIYDHCEAVGESANEVSEAGEEACVTSLTYDHLKLPLAF